MTDPICFRQTAGRCLLVLVFLLAGSARPLQAQDLVRLTDIAGEQFEGSLKSWSTDQLVLASPEERLFQHSRLQSVRFERSNPTRSHTSPSIWLTNGDRLAARSLTVDKEVLSLSWTVRSDKELSSIPLEDITAIIFDWPHTVQERLRLIADLETLSAGSDLVMLSNGDRTFGEFQRLDAAFVELKVAGKTLKLDRSRVRAIRLDPELATLTRPQGKRVVLMLVDGSQLTVTGLEIEEEFLKAKSTHLGSFALPVAAVVGCHFFGDGIVPVADYEPEKVEYTPYLSGRWSLVRNANVLHGPLTVQETEYVTGLGMHSRMSATYALRGDEKAFRALVGIDDVATDLGSVRFTVELDGRRIWSSPEMTGKAPVRSTKNLSLEGGKKLTLTVEFGEYADVGDYANWCDAVFVLASLDE